ncbi:hypothetical protein, partial [Escherichia coli]|uniref:hypothetical protein n=1 Tax=Escherichia coli TaxID=562 RepID=UPI003078F4C3
VAPVSVDLGTFAAGLDLPKDAPTGAAAIVVSTRSGPERSYEAPFRIEDYRRPTFEVKAAASAPRALVGEEVAFDVSAAYFEGGPVASAPLTWSL